MVISGMDMQEALNLIKIQPDLKVTTSNSILFIHRQLKNGSIYFISNQANTKVNFETAFRIAGKAPELWDGVTGTRRMLTDYSQNATTTSIPMQLEPLESAFVVFRKVSSKNGTNRSNYPTAEKTMMVTSPWAVSFDHKMRGPAKPVVFNTLTDWSTSLNDSVKYYSGTAYYRNTFKIDQITKGANYCIDLGVVKAIAKVFVNGLEVGGAWTPPYRVDITKALKQGKNKLEIKVVNTWMNRLVGDLQLPADQRKTIAQFGPAANSELEPSGLLGPVKIETIKY